MRKLKIGSKYNMTPRDTKTLKVNFIWSLLGNIVYAICQWAYLAVITKQGSTEMVGIFSLGLAITAPIFVLSGLQLRGILVTDVKDEYKFEEYLTLRLITIVCSFFTVLVMLFIIDYNMYISIIIIFIAIYKSIESISDIIFGLFQKKENMLLISISMMIKGALTVTSIIVVLIMYKDLIMAVISMSIVMLVIFFMIDLVNLRRYGNFALEFKVVNIRSLFVKSLPLGIVMMLISLNTNIPRYFLGSSVGLSELGIFTSISYLMVAGYTVISAFGQSASPKLAKYYAGGDKKLFTSLLYKMLGVALIIFLCGLAIGLVVGEKILILLFSKEYIGYQNLLNLIIVSAGIGFIASFLGYGLTAVRAFKVQLPIFIGVVLSNLIASFLLIPTKGLEGAAFALMISSLVNIILVSIVLFKKVTMMKKSNVVPGNIIDS